MPLNLAQICQVIAYKILIYGLEGIGKSTFGDQSKDPVAIQCEDGLAGLSMPRFPLAKSFDDVIRQLDELLREEHDRKTVVIDSIDFLEKLIHAELCMKYGKEQVQQIEGGYGKGEKYALKYWKEVTDRLDMLKYKKNVSTILIAHSAVKDFKDPEHPDYSQHLPSLDKNAVAYICAWVDDIGFATRKMFVSKGEDDDRARARTSGDNRIIRWVGSPSCVAKNRHGMPAETELKFSAVAKYLQKEIPAKSPGNSIPAGHGNATAAGSAVPAALPPVVHPGAAPAAKPAPASTTADPVDLAKKLIKERNLDSRAFALEYLEPFNVSKLSDVSILDMPKLIERMKTDLNIPF